MCSTVEPWGWFEIRLSARPAVKSLVCLYLGFSSDQCRPGQRRQCFSSPPCPSLCFFLIFAADFPCSFPLWSSFSAPLYNCSVSHKNSISTQIYDWGTIISRACTFSLVVCVRERYRVRVCVSSRLVCQVLVTVSVPTVYMCLDEEELPRKSQILSLKMNHCVCFVV